MTTLQSAAELHPRILAYLGDAWYEQVVRRHAITRSPGAVRPEAIHAYVVARVRAEFQAGLVERLLPHLTEKEQEIVRRGRNCSPPTGRRASQTDYRQATGFEALLGYLALSSPERLESLWTLLLPCLDPEIQQTS